MNAFTLKTPTIRVPGLLSDEALQEQLKLQKQNFNGGAEQAPTGALEMADRVQSEFFDAPVRNTIRAMAPLAGPLNPALQLAASVKLPDAISTPQVDAQQRAVDVRSDILSNDTMSGPMAYMIGGPLGFAVRDGGALAELGTLTPEQSEQERQRREAAAGERELAVKRMVETRQKLRNLTQEEASAMGLPIQPGIDAETEREQRQIQEQLDVDRVKRAEERTADAKVTAPKTTWWLNSIRSYYGGLNSMFTGIGKGAAIGLWELPGELSGVRDEGRSDMRAWFDTVDATMQKVLPTDVAQAEDFTTKLSQGAGSMVGFMVAGAIAHQIGLPAKASTMIVGATSGASQQYEDAERFGAAGVQRLISFMAGAGLGMTEAIPINRALMRLETATGGAVSRGLQGTAAASLEEFIQELGQNLGQDVVAKAIYDEQRVLDWKGYLEAGAVGGILGAMGGGAAETLGRSGFGRKPQTAEQPTQDAAPAIDEQAAFLETFINDAQVTFDQLTAEEPAVLGARQDTPAAGEAIEAVVPEDAATSAQSTATAPLDVANQLVERAATERRPGTQVADDFVAALPRPSLFDYKTTKAAGGTVPAPDDNGKIVLRHYSSAMRPELDPEKQGTGPLIGQERARLYGPDAVPRTYYGVRTGPDFVQPAATVQEYAKLMPEERKAAQRLGKAGANPSMIRGALEARYRREAQAAGYQNEGLGSFMHEVEVDPDSLYNMQEDPLNLREQLDKAAPQTARVTQYERLVKAAGFKGAYFPSGPLGQTAVLFEKATPARVVDERYGLPVDEIATPEDFATPTPESFAKGGWAVVTATQEAEGNYESEFNKAANEKLRARLEREKIPFIEVGGAYQGEFQGTSFMIFAPEATAQKLGKAFKQESILTRDGLVYTDGSDRVVPGRGVTVGPEAATQDFYSQMPDGTAWTMDLDFDAGQLFAARAPVRDGGLPMFPERTDQSFDRWFGDSKVVNEDGAPKVVYHGTPTKDGFRVFDPKRTGITSVLFSQIEQHRQGFFFAENKEFANTFADQDRAKGKGRIMEVFLSIQNPFDATSSSVENMRAFERIWERMQEIDPEFNNPRFIEDRIGSDEFWETLDTAEGGDTFVQAMRDLGYDGVKMVEPNHDTRESETVWVAFDNTQVKSAEENTGGYSRTNPDIFAATSSTRRGYSGEASRPTAGVAGQTNPDADNVNLRQIANNFSKLLGLTVRQGRMTLKGADVMGQYSTGSGVIRLRTPNDLSTLVHEGGHALERNADGPLRKFTKDNEALLKIAARRLYGGDTSNMSDATLVAEGFAEFFRIYTLNKRFAEVNFSHLDTAFTAMLDQHNPQLRDGLRLIGDQYAAWLQLPSSQLVRNMIVSGKETTGINGAIAEAREQGLGNWFREWVNGIFTGAINRNNDLNNLVSDILNVAEANRNAPLDLKRADDPRVLIRMATNAGNRAMVQLTDGVMPYRSTDPTTPGLRAVLLRYHGQKADSNLSAIDPVRQQDFAAYVVALRGIDEFARFSQGLIERPPLAATLGDLNTTITELEAKYGADFQEAAQMLHEYSMGLWEKGYQAGLIDDKTYQDGLSRTFYVPLQRDMSDKEITQSGISASAARQGRSIVKRFRGSDRDVIDPMDALMQKTFALEKVIAENEVKKALAKLADQAGQAGALVERVPAHRLLGQQYSIQEVARQITKDPTMSQTDAQDLLTLLETAIDEGNRIALFRSQQATAAGENIIFFWEKGKLAALQLKDGDVGTDIINTLNAVGTETVPLLVDLIAYPSTFFRAAVTSWPDFLLVNFIRDQMSAFVLTEGYKPFVTGMRGVGDEIRQGDWARQYNAAMGTMGGMNTSTLHSARVNRDIAALRKKGYVARVFGEDGMAGKIKGLARITELTETGTRLGIYRTAYERAKADGLTDWEASVEASYISTDYIDFGLHGNRMMAWRRLVPFLNAQLQGLYKMMRTLGGDEVRQRKGLRFAVAAFFKDTNGLQLSRAERQAVRVGRKAWLKMASLGIIGAAIQAVFEDDPDYQDASEYLRTTGWVIPIGNGEIFYIPKPFELAMVSNIVERAFEHASGDKEAKWRMLRGMAMNLVPPTNPPAIQAIVEQLGNYDYFSSREIVPDYMRALEPELQYNHYTTEFAKSVGAAFGWSPMRIDHALSALGASAYRDLSQMYNMTDPSRPASDRTEWPITRRFVRDARRGAASAQDFWKFASTVDGSLRRAELTYRNYIESGREAAAESYLSDLDPDEKAYALLNTHFKAEYKRLNPTYRARQMTTIVSALRRELFSDLGVENSGPGGELDPFMLSAKEKADVDTLMSEYARREVRNSLVYMKAPGWANKKPLPTEPTIEMLRATSPMIAEEFERRIKKAKVYDAATVQEYWPEVRDRLLSDRDEAFLKDILTIAKVMR